MQAVVNVCTLFKPIFDTFVVFLISCKIQTRTHSVPASSKKLDFN